VGEVIGLVYRENGSQPIELKSRLTVVSQGSMKSFGKALNKSETEVSGYMLRIIIRDCELPYKNYGHVILADPSPLLSYPVGQNAIRILIDIHKDMPSMKGNSLNKYLIEIIRPQMPLQLQKGFEVAVNAGNFKAKPTCELASRPILQDGVVLLGDSLNMRHPITGGE